MKKTHYFFFAVVLAAIVFFQIDSSNRLKIARKNRETVKAVASLEQEKTASQNKGDVATNVVVPVVKPIGMSPELFIKKFKSEARTIGKVQADPTQAVRRLRKLADEIHAQQVEALYELISDDRNSQDERALAVELLSLKNDTASLMALQNFVSNKKNVNGVKWDRKKEFEMVLRAQAVEGISHYPEREIALSTLTFLQSRVEEKFLSERIGRATLDILAGQRKSTLQKQDEEALQKLIE